MQENYSIPYQLFALAWSVLLITQTACMNDHHQGLGLEGSFAGSSRSINTTASQQSTLSDNLGSITSQIAAEYLLKANTATETDEEAIEALLGNKKMSDETRRAVLNLMMKRGRPTKLLAEAALAKLQQGTSQDAIDEEESESEGNKATGPKNTYPVLEEAIMPSKEKDDKSEGEKTTNSIGGQNNTLHSELKEIFRVPVSIIKDERGTRKRIKDEIQKDRQNKYKQLVALFDQQKATPEYLVKAIIKELDEVGIEYDFMKYDGEKEKIEHMCYLLKETYKNKRISKQGIVDVVIDHYAYRLEVICNLLKDLLKGKVISLSDMILGILANKNPQYNQHWKLLVRIFKDSYYKTDFSALKNSSSACQLLQVILDGHFLAEYGYELLRLMHWRQVASLQTILQGIIKNNNIDDSYKKGLIQYIFEKSTYFKEALANLDKDALPTLQQITKEYFKPAEHKALLMRVPKSLKGKAIAGGLQEPRQNTY